MAGRPLRWFVLANVLALGGAVCVGAVVAGTGDHTAVFAPRPGDAHVDVRANALALLAQNGRAWVYTVGGALSFGAASVFVLLANGVRLGTDIVAVARGDWGELLYLVPHGLPEFAALTLAAAASEHLGLQLFGTLFRGTPFRGAALDAQALGLSAALLIGAAFVEAVGQLIRHS